MERGRPRPANVPALISPSPHINKIKQEVTEGKPPADGIDRILCILCLLWLPKTIRVNQRPSVVELVLKGRRGRRRSIVHGAWAPPPSQRPCFNSPFPHIDKIKQEVTEGKPPADGIDRILCILCPCLRLGKLLWLPKNIRVNPCPSVVELVLEGRRGRRRSIDPPQADDASAGIAMKPIRECRGRFLQPFSRSTARESLAKPHATTPRSLSTNTQTRLHRDLPGPGARGRNPDP